MLWCIPKAYLQLAGISWCYMSRWVPDAPGKKHMFVDLWLTYINRGLPKPFDGG